jgi:hypothetical protein
MLWLAVLKEREHIAAASDPAIRCRHAACPETEEGLKGSHWLPPAVVTEDKLVEVRLQLGAADAVMCGNEPILKIADDTIRERYDRPGTLAERRGRRLLQRDVTIARRLQTTERGQAIGVDRRPGRDGFLHDRRHRRSGEVGQHRKPDAARPVFAALDRDKHWNRAAVFQLPAPRDAGCGPPIQVSSISTAPCSGSRAALTIARRSLCRIIHAVSYRRRPSCRWIHNAEAPRLSVVIRYAAQNHWMSGVFVL